MKTCLLLGSLLLAGCARPPDEPEAAAATPAATTPTPTHSTATTEVRIDNFTYSPPTLTVAVGTRVTWTNHDDVPHTVTSSTRPRLLESPTLDSDQKYSHVFTAPGTFEYFCTVHPKMTGTIIVK